VTADQVKNGKAASVTNDRLAVDQARTNRELGHGRCDEREATREIVSGARNQPHAGSIAPRKDAKAIMFDFVEPTGTAWRRLGRRGQTRLDNPQTGGGYARATT
jgi:hypothetical protein